MTWVALLALTLFYISSHGASGNQAVVPISSALSIDQLVPDDGRVAVSVNAITNATSHIDEYTSDAGTKQNVVGSQTASTVVAGLQKGATYTITFFPVSQTTKPIVTSTVSGTGPHWSGLQPRQMGLLINDNDPDSVTIGAYYQQRRHIPAENIVHLNISKITRLTIKEFMPLKAIVDAKLSNTVQALALAWTIPYAVECNSITSAFALGYMGAPCETHTCSWANASLYYNSDSTQPFTDFKMRPAMMLAAKNVNEAKALIDRGIASDMTYPRGSAYIMNTTDRVRSFRAERFPTSKLGNVLSPYVNAQIKSANSISNTSDALFYFQGLAFVDNISKNKFPPGAVADHVTSFGGVLTSSGQMSALEFISGGATGTFGTVSEPCSIPYKFPLPTSVISFYTKGESLIEAYWKSISQTFQGVFVGEPLANPWKKRLS